MTQQQTAVLAAELLNDPEGLGYAAWLPDSPGTVADLINAPTQTMIKPIRATTAQAWAATGPYAKVVDAANDAEHPCRASCLVVQQAFAAAVDIHLERADMQQMLTAWVATGICTAAQRNDLMARAMQPASRAEVLGLGAVTITDIIEAQ
jgi:hypothetical protein